MDFKELIQLFFNLSVLLLFDIIHLGDIMGPEEYIMDLKNRYNYNNSLTNLLFHIIPAMIEYFGDKKKDLILSAIEDTYIHFQNKDENMYDYLKDYFNYKKTWSFSHMDEVFYENEYVLNSNIINSKNIIYIRQIFYGEYIPFDFSNSICISNLVHELCHLVKSYGTLKLDNELKSKSGLKNIYYKCDINNGLLVEDSCEYAGLEKALNTIDEEEIMKIMGLNCEKNDGYSEMASSLRKLLCIDFINETFKKSEFEGDFWLNILGEDGILLAKYFDEWLVLINTPFDIVIMDDHFEDRIKVVKRNVDFIISKYIKENNKGLI